VSAAVRFVTVSIAGAAISLLGILLSAWWLTFLAGVAAGALLTRPRWAIPAGALTGLIAWTVPLVYAQVEFGLRDTSLSLAAIMGFNGAATIPLTLTLLVGSLLGLTGAWLGAAARGLFPNRPPASGESSTRATPAERVPAAIGRR
jgi:hypothetical protein